MSRIDLHMHSYYSDGKLSPAAIVELAAKKGLKAISLTDHDSIEGYKEAHNAGIRYNIEVIPGIELSANISGKDIHILAYFVDTESKKLRDYLELFREKRKIRAEKMVVKLQNLGVQVSMKDVIKIAGKGAIGRPHIAMAVCETGIVDSIDRVFYNYIGFGRHAYVEKYKITPEEILRLVTEAGGISFLAHPNQKYISDEIISHLINIGLDGIETIHPKLSEHHTGYYRGIVNEFCLLESGGSDCHGSWDNRIMIGSQDVPYLFLNNMKRSLRILEDQ